MRLDGSTAGVAVRITGPGRGSTDRGSESRRVKTNRQSRSRIRRATDACCAWSGRPGRRVGSKDGANGCGMTSAPYSRRSARDGSGDRCRGPWPLPLGVPSWACTFRSCWVICCSIKSGDSPTRCWSVGLVGAYALRAVTRASGHADPPPAHGRSATACSRSPAGRRPDLPSSAPHDVGGSNVARARTGRPVLPLVASPHQTDRCAAGDLQM